MPKDFLIDPGEFIGGTVCDPAENRAITGAVCLLTGGGLTFRAETDSCGAFRFRGLPKDGEYTLEISAPGFKAKQFAQISTEKSVNLGGIPLEKD